MLVRKLRHRVSDVAATAKVKPNLVLRTAALGVDPARARVAVEGGLKLRQIAKTHEDIKRFLASSTPQVKANLKNVLQHLSATRRALDPPEKQRVVYTFRFAAYDTTSHLASTRCAIAARLLGMKCSGPVPLPRRTFRIAVLKSPFKYKKHQEHWEIRTYPWLVQVETNPVEGKTLLDFVKQTTPGGAFFRYTVCKAYPLDVFYTNPYLQEPLGKPLEGIDYSSLELPSVEATETSL